MKFKKILSGILACATVCSAVPYVSYNFSGNISITANATAYTTGTYENLTYKAYTNYIEISKCDSSATSAVIPAEINGLPVTSIGAGAFDGCKSLTEITIPDSVTYIGLEAFSGCSSLTEITIPDSVTNIAERAFFSCSVLTEIKLSKNITNVDSNTFAFCESLKSITIPDGVTNIGANAFSKCSDLTEITIPESVESIGEDTFYGCEKLEKITIENPDCVFNTPSIPSTATIYGYENSTAQTYAQQNGNEFAVIENSETNQKTYGLFTYEVEDTFADGTQITITDCDTSAEGVVDIPNEIDGIPVRTVESSTFKDCLKITAINVPENVTGLSILTENVKTEGNSLLEAVNVDEKNTAYCSEDGILFTKDKTMLTKYPPAHKGDSYDIPDTVTEIQIGAFFKNQYLKSITIPENIESIPTGAFYECKNLESVKIEYGVNTISELAFYGCTNIKEIDIPSTVDTIYCGAFADCTGLEKAYIGARVINSYGFLETSGAFSGCTSLKDITFSDSLAYIGRNTFKDTLWLENQPDGMVYINDIAYKYKGKYSGDGEFTIRDGITGISGGAFENISGIESIITPKSLYELNGEEFIYCNDLKSITVLNPECRIDYILVDDNTFPDVDYPSIYHGTIKGYDGSTAQAYAKEQENEFIIIDSAVSELKGDCNLDGNIDIADVVSISAYVGNSKNNPLSEQSILNADVHNTGDGLTANDALMIQQYLSGNITNLE